MYKAAFPWSSLEHEEREKKYIKSLPETGEEEVAGNVWISPEAGSQTSLRFNASSDADNISSTRIGGRI